MAKKKNSKRAGNTYERLICKIFMDRFPGHKFSRTGGSGARFWDKNISDRVKDTLIGDIVTDENFRFTIECKGIYKELQSYFPLWDNKKIDSFLDQALKESEESEKDFMLILQIANKGPIIFSEIHTEAVKELSFTKNNKNIYCVRLEDFLKNKDEIFWKCEK